MATRDTPPNERNATPAAPDDKAAASPASEVAGAGETAPRQFVYHVNPATNQVLKVEEIDPGTGQRKELTMSNAQYDPYAGQDPQGAQGAYDRYGAQSGYADYSAYQQDPYTAAFTFPTLCFPPRCFPPPPCIPPRCLPPLCLPPRCIPPTCIPTVCLPQAPVQAQSQMHANMHAAALSPTQVRAAAVVFALVGNLDRITPRYASRGYRYMLFEAGHVAQNVYLLGAGP